MTSVNTNYGALIALQALNQTTRELDEVQNRVNTGLKVATAKDNGAVFAIAQQQRARVGALSAVQSGIDRATSTIDVALSAGQSISDLLIQLKEKAIAAMAEDLSTDQRAALGADFTALRNQINQIANASTFNGVNLVAAGGSNMSVLTSDLSGASVGRQIQSTVIAGTVPSLSGYLVGNGSVVIADDSVFRLNGVAIGTVDITATMTVSDYLSAVSTATGGRVTASYNQATGQFTYVAPEAVAVSNELSITSAGTARSWLGQGVAATAVTAAPVTTTVTDLDFTVDGAGALASVTSALALTNASNAQAASAAIDTAITVLNQQLASLGSQAKALDVQQAFLGKLSDSIVGGIGNLVDADLAKESARLQALQVKQQLGAQALSIANSAPSIVLSFFR
ncbi:MAG: flagellin [Hyphomonadaceae bacterium]